MSIGDLARASGVSVGTIRVWERRYGRPVADRLPSGHRRYRASQVAWLRTVAEAVAAGMRASAAVLAAPAALQRVVAPPPAPCGGEISGLVALAAAMRPADLRRRLRREARSMPVVTLLETRVAPLLAELGRAWSEGRIEVRHEHLASDVVADLLRELCAKSRPRRAAPRIVLSSLPGDRHDLGVRMAAAVAAGAGFQPVVLGADTPTGDIVAAAAETGALAVAIGISLPRGGVEADRLIRSLRESLGSQTRLIAGGAGARGPRRAPRGVEIVSTLPELDTLLRGLRPARTRKSAPR